jgi:putative ABC transport system permease protein
LWQRQYHGDLNVLGSSLVIDSYQRQQFTIVGIMPETFDAPQGSALWLSAGAVGVTVPPAGAARRGGPWFEVIARLKPGVSLEAAGREMATVAEHLAAKHPSAAIGTTAAVVPLQDHVTGPVSATLLALFGAVSLLLLAACVNVACLLLARCVAQQKEFAVRVALGASRRHLMRQLIGESLLLSVSGGALGVVFAALLVSVARSSSFIHDIPRLEEVRVDSAVLAFAVIVSVLTGILFGVLPARESSHSALQAGLQETGRSGTSSRRRRRLQTGLIASQIAAAVVLMTVTGLVARSLLRLNSIDPGFDPNGVLVMTLDMSVSTYTADGSPRPQTFFRDVLNRVRALPGVSVASGASALPFETGGWVDRPGGAWSNQGFFIQGQHHPADRLPTADPRVITPDYFGTLKIPVRAGRLLLDTDHRDGLSVVVINETMARRYWPGHSPLGQSFSFDERAGQRVWRQIVGVVGDVRTGGYDAEPRPEFYLPYEQSVWHQAELLVRSSPEIDARSLLPAIRSVLKEVDPNVPLDRVRTLEQMAANTTLQPRIRTYLLTAFAAIALLLATMGLYGMLSSTVAESRREIGVRMALGARPAAVVFMIVRRTLFVTAYGVALGLLGSVFATQSVRSLLFDVSATDPLTFAGVVATLFFSALFAAYLPAQRAARVDPATTLRAE